LRAVQAKRQDGQQDQQASPGKQMPGAAMPVFVSASLFAEQYLEKIPSSFSFS
jgi:hypothetical protein